MSNVRIELNSEGIKQLLKSDEMINVLQENADRVVSKCGSGYTTDKRVGKTRANISIKANTKKTIRDNFKNNTLLKALGSARTR